MDIPADEQVNYKYIGQSLVYDPVVPMDELMERSRLPLPGNRGIFTHPALRFGATSHAKHRYSKSFNLAGKSGSSQHSTSKRSKQLQQYSSHIQTQELSQQVADHSLDLQQQ